MTIRRHVTVCSREYVRSHGQEPRGRGAWLFRFERDNKVIEDMIGQAPTTYREARKVAVDYARQIGATTVVPLP